jgi:hypothetical protein
MKSSGSGFLAGSLAGIFLFILSGCASAPEVPVLEDPVIEIPFWEIILDEIPWEDRMVGNIVADENTLPPEMFSVMYGHGYQYVNSTYKTRQEDAPEIGDLYELKRENVSYDPFDDTFMFIGEFLSDEANLWLIFSKERDYELFAEPDALNKAAYTFTKVSGRAE